MQPTVEQNHVVQFYNNEDFLCERVADFLGTGLTSGEPIVIIASEQRNEAFSRRLSEKGFEVEPARTRGQLTWLDAHHTLAQFMVGTMPDWGLFNSTVGGMLERSAGGRQTRVRAYGEMVDILWKAGNPRGAIRLEEMWNELAKSHSFNLLCAYVMGSFYKSQAGTALQQVCALHSAVVPPESEDDRSGGGEPRVGQEAIEALVAEIGHRQQVEESLRLSLRELRQSEERERSSSLRVARLQQATSSLATALTVNDVANTIISLNETVLGAVASVVYLLDEESGAYHLVASRGAPSVAEQWPVLPLDAPLPLAAAISRRESIWFENYEDLVQAHPQVAVSRTPTSHKQASVAMPLVHAGRLLGGFALSFENIRRFNEEDREWLTLFAAQGALAVDRARLFEAEKRAVEELTETVRMNELFAGVLAHDLRNPLGAILTAAQLALLRQQRGSSEKLDVPLSRIVSSGRRMARMVDQLLDLSRIRLGAGMNLEPKSLDLQRVMDQVIEELRDGHPEAPLSLEAVGDCRGVWDGDRLFQVFSNLVGNALQHGREDTGVLVRVDGTGSDVVRVGVHNMGVVRAELVAKLFEPLVGGERRAEGSSGLGLGLFIASQIVKAHGGRIQFASTEAAGTTFSVGLPRVVVPGKGPGWGATRVMSGGSHG